MKPEIYCVGNVVADIVLGPVDGLPRPGAIQMVERGAFVPGGNAVNTAIALARLGRSVRVAGAVGNDRFGRLMREALRHNGVDDSSLTTVEGAATAVTVVLVESSGERRFLHVLGANGVFSEDHLNWSLVQGSHFFHYASAFVLPLFDGEPLANAMGRAKQEGMRTSLDACWDASGRGVSLLRPALGCVDLMFLNRDEGAQLTGEQDPVSIAAHLRDLGVGAVVVKLGSAGCYVASRDQAFRSPGFAVKPVDTTGAGDCFAAAFLATLCEGADLEQAGRLANAAGALATLVWGGSDAAPTRSQVEKFLEARGRETAHEVSSS